MHQSPLASGSPEIVTSKDGPNIQGYGLHQIPARATLFDPFDMSRGLSIWDVVIAKFPELERRSTRDTLSPNAPDSKPLEGLENAGL